MNEILLSNFNVLICNDFFVCDKSVIGTWGHVGGPYVLRGTCWFGYNSAFTLDVRDSSVESPNTMLAIQDLNIVTMKILC